MRRMKEQEQSSLVQLGDEPRESGHMVTISALSRSAVTENPGNGPFTVKNKRNRDTQGGVLNLHVSCAAPYLKIQSYLPESLQYARRELGHSRCYTLKLIFSSHRSPAPQSASQSNLIIPLVFSPVSAL